VNHPRQCDDNAIFAGELNSAFQFETTGFVLKRRTRARAINASVPISIHGVARALL